MIFFEEKEDVFVSMNREQILEISNVQNVTLFFLLQKNKLQSDVAKKEDLFYNNFSKEDEYKTDVKKDNEAEEKIKNRL